MAGKTTTARALGVLHACDKMRDTITKLCAKHGVDIRKTGAHLKLENKGWQPLCIENVGIGETRISVAHYFEQNGDLVSDPDMTFVEINGRWYPATCQNQFSYTEAIETDAGVLKGFRLRAQTDLADFARMWERNIRAQGWLEVTEATRKGTGDE